ncbi:hypothetical protein Tco_0700083, partial [Tanacetum coccineum]
MAQVSLAGKPHQIAHLQPLKDPPNFGLAKEQKNRKIDRLGKISLIQRSSPNDIYSLIDSNVLLNMFMGCSEIRCVVSEYGEQDSKLQFYMIIRHSKATEGNRLLDTYLRYLQVINDLKKCGYKKDNCELNYKFLNNLQPEWKQYGTLMRQTKNLMDINIDSLYNILKQNQGDVNDVMGYKKKVVMESSSDFKDQEINANMGLSWLKMEKIVQICLWIIDSNNDFAVIAGFGDVVIGSMTIKKVYYVEGLGHNLFSVGQFCDKGLEVAFRKSTCFVRNEDGVDLLTGGSVNSNLCYILNDYDDVGKLKAKGDIGVFVGYLKEFAALRVYNKRTQKIHESVNVNFDEISEMASKQFNNEISNNNEIPSHEGEVFHKVSESFQEESSSSSLNDDVQQSSEEVM